MMMEKKSPGGHENVRLSTDTSRHDGRLCTSKVQFRAPLEPGWAQANRMHRRAAVAGSRLPSNADGRRVIGWYFQDPDADKGAADAH